jgi:autotransporter family porin
MAAVVACVSAVGSSPAHADARFRMKPVGAALPTAAACRDKVIKQSSGLEIRPKNAAVNNRTGGGISVKVLAASKAWNRKYASRIKGDLVKPRGRSTTTAEVLDWAACKWGLDSYLMRAIAVQESAWRHSQLGDKTSNPRECRKIGKSAPCYQSYGLIQIKGTTHLGTYPMTAQSAPFAADFAGAFLHACYNGAFTWLKKRTGYRAGDIWGCVSMYYSGSWKGGLNRYARQVKKHYDTKAWTEKRFVSAG